MGRGETVAFSLDLRNDPYEYPSIIVALSIRFTTITKVETAKILHSDDGDHMSNMDINSAFTMFKFRIFF